MRGGKFVGTSKEVILDIVKHRAPAGGWTQVKIAESWPRPLKRPNMYDMNIMLSQMEKDGLLEQTHADSPDAESHGAKMTTQGRELVRTIENFNARATAQINEFYRLVVSSRR